MFAAGMPFLLRFRKIATFQNGDIRRTVDPRIALRDHQEAKERLSRAARDISYLQESLFGAEQIKAHVTPGKQGRSRCGRRQY
jgi:hypothetical protein